ncbi:unnamed protein product [Orchesella dallaii]|uniref:Protein quiver n=1 Tax=Orchesella dallaii TaxID=48710 RepID=A0ABP1PR60_9HEXA
MFREYNIILQSLVQTRDLSTCETYIKMFMFSRKFVSFIVVMMLVFGGDRSVIGSGLICWHCNGKDNVCDADHSGKSIGCDGLFVNDFACAMEQVPGTQEIKKFCQELENTNGLMGCHEVGQDKIKHWVCYCDTDSCNKDKNYGMADISKPGSGNAGVIKVTQLELTISGLFLQSLFFAGGLW